MDGPLLLHAAGDGAFDLKQPSARRLPLVFASPHSGTAYPADFVEASRLDPLTLRRSEDSFVDDLFAAAPLLGAPLLAARFPRAYLDVNREPWELDPGMFSDALPGFVNVRSPRVRMGLGTIPRIVATGEDIYAHKLCFAEAERRIAALYQPYHRMLSHLLEETVAGFGGYLLVDCHSMPSTANEAGRLQTADIVLGDCHGAACSPRIMEAAGRYLAERGLVIAINAPYAGGFTTDHYGRPPLDRHALQVEINRALYMNERTYRRKPAFEDLADTMAGLVECLGAVMQSCLALAG